MSESSVIGVDLAKSVFEIAVSRQPGRISERHRLSRARFLEFFAQLQPVTVVLESCGSAHHFARELVKLGHCPVLLPAQHVRPYVRGNKTDSADAAALLEAFRNQQIRPVPVKTCAQQALTGLHRLRSGWQTTRIARLNAVRGLLREFGVVIPVGARHVLPQLTEQLARSPEEIPAVLHPVLLEMADEIRELERRIATVDTCLAEQSRQLPEVARLRTIPGIGPLTATALVAFVGDVQRFRSSRHFASFLGLTPREHSSGLRRHLGRISKRGDTYLRTLLIHGARAVLRAAKRRQAPDRLRAWALSLQATRGHNKAAVALANKLARTAWAVWRRGTTFEARPTAQPA